MLMISQRKYFNMTKVVPIGILQLPSNRLVVFKVCLHVSHAEGEEVHIPQSFFVMCVHTEQLQEANCLLQALICI